MFIKILILLISVFSPILWTGENGQRRLSCAPELRKTLATVQMLPEAEELIAQVLEDGPLSIEVNHYFPKKFEGYWSDSDRTVYITPTSSEAGKISTLLFELHNAKRNEDLRHLDHLAARGQINKNEFVRAVEYIEYQNALSTSALLDQGIEKKIFPRKCYWYLPDFNEHLRVQKSAGHSAYIGKRYNQLKAC